MTFLAILTTNYNGHLKVLEFASRRTVCDRSLPSSIEGKIKMTKPNNIVAWWNSIVDFEGKDLDDELGIGVKHNLKRMQILNVQFQYLRRTQQTR